ncbi:MAG: (d)CMP kinase [Candidatus Dormibacteraceae bacterium]
MTEPVVVAIDGPAGAGKSAVSRRVAAALGLPFVDSGLFYRAVAWLALEEKISPGDVPALVAIARRPGLQIVDERIRDGERDLTDQIHRPEINSVLSAVASVAEVREAINLRQRDRRLTGVVMAGRDIGTVVFPDATHKFFLTAGLEERVRRRVAQIERRGETVDAGRMAREIADRDRADTERAVAPLRPAVDAHIVDTDGLAVDAVVRLIVDRVRG